MRRFLSLCLCLIATMLWADPATEVSIGVKYQQTSHLWTENGESISLDVLSGLSGAVFSSQSIWLQKTWKLSAEKHISLDWEAARNLQLSGDVFDQGQALGRRSEGSSGMGDPVVSWWGRTGRSARYTLWRGFSLRVPLGNAETRLPLGQSIPSVALSWRLLARSPAHPHLLEASVSTLADGFPALAFSGKKTFLSESLACTLGASLQKSFRTRGARAPELREILGEVAPGQSHIAVSAELAYKLSRLSVFVGASLPVWAAAESSAVVWQLGIRPSR